MASLHSDHVVDLTTESPAGDRLSATFYGVSPLASEAPGDHAQLVDQLATLPAGSDAAQRRMERESRRASQELPKPHLTRCACHASCGTRGTHSHWWSLTQVYILR